MRSVTVRLEDLKTIVLCLGYVGENEHTRVTFDAKKMYDQYPHAAVSLSVTPPDGESYPAVIERDGDNVIWDVVDSNLTAEGSGEYQLAFTDDPHVARTYVGKFKVKRSIMPTGNVPTALDDFLTRAGAALTAIPETIDAALEEAKESGEFDGEDGVGIQSIAKTGSAGLVDTYTITLTDGRTYGFNVKNGKDGEDGDDGVGISSIRKTGTSGLVDTYTITYTNGQTATFNVTNGAKGDPGDDYVLTEEDKEEIAGMVDLSELEEDVSELKSAIQAKVDEPQTEGTDGQVLATDGDGGRYWKTVSGGGGGTSDYTELTNKPQINGVTLDGNKTGSQFGLLSGDDVADAVADWCDENITEDPTVIIDKSLKVSGAAADAKQTGIEIEDLNGMIGSGLSNTASTLLLTILNEAVYGSDQSANLVLLAKELAKVKPVSISAVLTSTPYVGLHYEDLEFTVTATFDDSSTAVLEKYFIMTEGSVVSGSNTVTIRSRGLSVDVTFTADASTTYSITNVLTHMTTDNPTYIILSGERYVAELTVEDEYAISSYSVTMGGVDVTSTVYNNGHIVIDEVTGDVVITVTASQNTDIPLILRRAYSNEGDSVARLYTDEYVSKVSDFAYYHVGRITEYPAKADCTLTWRITNTSEESVALTNLGFGMISGSEAEYINNNAIAYWQKIDNVSHSLSPGDSLTGTYTLKAGWQLILTTSSSNNDALETFIYGNYVPETFSDYTKMYTITNDSTQYPQIGNYRTFKFYSDNGTTEIKSINGWPRKIAEGLGPVEYDALFRAKFDPSVNKTQGACEELFIGYIDDVNASAANYAARSKAKSVQMCTNIWLPGSIKATTSGMILVTNALPTHASITIEVYLKEVTP